MSDPELETFVVLNRNLESVGVVFAESIGKAILMIPPNHGIDLGNDGEVVARQQHEILDVQSKKGE